MGEIPRAEFLPCLHVGNQGPAARDQGPGTRGYLPGARGQGPGARGYLPGTRDQGPGARGQGLSARDQGPGAICQGPGTRDQGPAAICQGLSITLACYIYKPKNFFSSAIQGSKKFF